MLKPHKNNYTKEQELQFGREIQEGIKAKEQLASSNELTKEVIDNLNVVIERGLQAQEALFNAEIGLANKLSNKLYRQAGVRYSADDMAQDAYLAIIEATKTYNPDKNCRFSTHAYYNIYKVVSTSLNKMRPVRLPENKMGQYLKISQAEREYIDKYNNYDLNAMQEYVLSHTDISKDVYIAIKQAMQPVSSMLAPVGGDTKFQDLLEDHTTQFTSEIQNPVLVEIFEMMTPEEREMVSVSYSVGRSQVNYDTYLREHNLTPEEMHKRVQSILRSIRSELKPSNHDKEAI